MSKLKYTVGSFREAGLEARWTKTSAGAPIIVLRNPKGLPHQRSQWYVITKEMWSSMNDVGIVEGFNRSTLLGDFFSVRA